MTTEKAEPSGVRLQKFLSRAGVASRRAAEVLIQEGRVHVNGECVQEMGTRIDPQRDRVQVDGKEVRALEKRWIVYHKPRGVLTTAYDPQGRETIYDRLPEKLASLRYVGRLDLLTEGLLLLTNDGELAHRLTHPSAQVEREYHAVVGGEVRRETVERLRQGVELEDGPARAKNAVLLETGEGTSTLKLVLTEGRKREVRRLCEAVGHTVRKLRRVRFGTLDLAGLEYGEWRPLTDREVQGLRKLVEHH